MNIKRLKRGCVFVLAMYFVLSILFFWIAGDQLRYIDRQTASVHPLAPLGELVQGIELEQPFMAEADEIRGISLMLSTYNRNNTSVLTVGIEDESGNLLAQTVIPALSIEDNAVRDVPFSEPVAVEPGHWYQLVLYSPDAVPGNAITAWSGNTVLASRTEIVLELDDRQKLRINGIVQDGLLHYSLQTRSQLWFGQAYWHLVLIVGIAVAGYLIYLVRAVVRGKSAVVLRLVTAFQRYSYLLRQLVARDFKTKYKRSVLGILWSFLNPLLTMLVQYIVFSTLFRSDIPNFPLYLLTGIVCFNFFTEATTIALQSIVGNASLITKVYVPKYIYPVSRVLSSTINLLLSMIPLLAVMLFTGAMPRPAMLLLPFGLLCLLVFCIGISFILSTAMVFFRDTQFLWGVLSMLWMYATPVFYPESIIPAEYMLIYKCNPMYHIIRFIRILLIDGVSPEPKAYAFCLLMSFAVLLIGAVVFKRNQDQFILYL